MAEFPSVEFISDVDERNKLATAISKVDQIPGAWDWFRTHDPPSSEGYYLGISDMQKTIERAIATGDESGSSMAITMRTLQAIVCDYNGWVKGMKKSQEKHDVLIGRINSWKDEHPFDGADSAVMLSYLEDFLSKFATIIPRFSGNPLEMEYEALKVVLEMEIILHGCGEFPTYLDSSSKLVAISLPANYHYTKLRWDFHRYIIEREKRFKAIANQWLSDSE